MSCDTSCDMNCEEGTGSRPDGAGDVAMALRALESPDWPQLTLAVLGRNGTRREVVQRLAAMLDRRAGRDGREKPDGEADTGKRVLTECERAILDMWPRFEDTGDPVMVGDAYIDGSGDCNIIVAVRTCEVCVDLVGEEGFFTSFKPGERVKRPAPEELDADGVEIHVGDTVYELETGEEYKVERVFSGATDPDFPDHTIRCNKVADLITHVFKPDQLTHTRPDSWEQLEEDAGEDPFRYCKTVGKRLDTFDNAEVFKSADIVRRAKKLAEVGE